MVKIMDAKNEKLLDILKQWQKLEDAAVHTTTEIIRKADNPFIQMIMEIIRQDSVMHRRVQQLIIENISGDCFQVSMDELVELWEMISVHEETEHKVIELAKESLEETDSPFVKYLLTYLLTDEEKHENLLLNLGKFMSKDEE